MIMMKKLSRKSFIEAATCTAANGREESFKRWGKRRIHGFFLLSSRLQHRVLVHFFQVLLTWLNSLKLNTFSALCNESKKSLLKWYPVPARLLSFDMARYSWQVQCACMIARLSPCTLWPLSFSLKSRDAKMAGQQHLGLFLFLSGPFGANFMKKTAREKRWSARVSPLKCTRSPRPVDRGRPQCPVSYPDNNSASRLLPR